MTSPPHGPEPPGKGEGEVVQWFIGFFSDVYFEKHGVLRCFKAFGTRPFA